MYAKIEVNGVNTHPLYAHLKHAAPGMLGSEAIKWNFTKFLTNRAGAVVGRHAPATEPAALANAIDALLALDPP
jgi:glutathione peroxidase